MDKKKILVTMLEVGFGHKSPAIAVKESIEVIAPDAAIVDVVDFAKEMSGAYRDDLALERLLGSRPRLSHISTNRLSSHGNRRQE